MTSPLSIPDFFLLLLTFSVQELENSSSARGPNNGGGAWFFGFFCFRTRGPRWGVRGAAVAPPISFYLRFELDSSTRQFPFLPSVFIVFNTKKTTGIYVLIQFLVLRSSIQKAFVIWNLDFWRKPNSEALEAVRASVRARFFSNDLIFVKC